MCFLWPKFMPGASAVEARSTANSGWRRRLPKWQRAHWLSGTALMVALRPLCSTWQVAQARSGAAAALRGSALPKSTCALAVRRPADAGSWQRWQRTLETPWPVVWHCSQLASMLPWAPVTVPGDSVPRTPTRCPPIRITATTAAAIAEG